MKNTKVVGGGGAIEMELSRYLREYARTISGKQQLVINYFARALEAWILSSQLLEIGVTWPGTTIFGYGALVGYDHSVANLGTHIKEIQKPRS